MTTERHVDSAYWARQRERIGGDAGVINFNTGTCGPVPRSVQRLIAELRDRQSNSPSDFFWRQLPPRLVYARRRLAEYLNVDADDLLLLSNVTVALNVAIAGMDFPPGSEIVTTDHEYGAMRLMLMDYARRRDWSLRIARLPLGSGDPAEYVDAVARLVNEKTKVIFFSHVTSPTGIVLPAKELCRLAADAGALSMVDGAHAPGSLPLDLEEVGADFYGANCHKWLMAPLGAGFLHVKREHRERVPPLVTSWGWGYDPEKADVDSGWGGSFWSRNLEFHGTQDRCAQMVLPEVLDFRTSIGDVDARRRQRYLAARLRKKFADAGLEALTPDHEKLSVGLTAFHVPNVDVIKVRDYVWNTYRLEAPVTTAANRCFWRFSTAWFNTEAEIDRAAEIAKSIPWESFRRDSID
jgi:isopenicillin-N epimerase